MRAVYGSKWLDWGVCRLKGMQPFCGHGFMTVDGEKEWRRYRAMMAPALADPNVLDFAGLDVALKTALSKIPQDGETVDMSPIFDELVGYPLRYPYTSKSRYMHEDLLIM
jgi:cytochrome P450